MKYLILSILMCINLMANDTKQKVTIGLGAYTQSQPYKGVNNLLLPTPVVFFDNALFYVRWSRVGMYFLGEKQKDYAWGFSLTAEPKTLGYQASDSSYLTGMDERKSTLEGGLVFSASYQNSKYIEIMLLSDMLHTYNSWISKVEIGDKYKLGDFSFYPSVVVSYQSRKFVDYYYGVKTSEARFNRPAYSPNGGLSYGAQTYIRYPLTEKISALFNFKYDIIPNSAQNSPLVDKKYIYSGLASLIYTFKY